MKVLVVEDEVVVARRLVRLIEGILGERCEGVLRAASLEEAREVIGAETPDVVFLDLQMPEMDGFETSRALLSNLPNLYIIAMTAAATIDDRQAGKMKSRVRQLDVGRPVALAEHGEGSTAAAPDDQDEEYVAY